MTAVPYLLALLAARADDDADTLADLRDLLGDEGAAAEALRHAGEDEGEEPEEQPPADQDSDADPTRAA